VATMRRVLFLPFAVVLASGLSALPAPPSEAYSLGSCQWGAVTSLRWSNFSGTTGIYETAVNTGASRWNATATPVSISQTASGNPTNFQVNTANFGNVSWVGRAPNFDTCPAGFYNAALPLQLNTYYLASYSATRRAGIAAHEFGHNLGLRHVGSDTTPCASVALMNPSAPRMNACGVYAPTADDVNGINAKY